MPAPGTAQARVETGVTRYRFVDTTAAGEGQRHGCRFRLQRAYARFGPVAVWTGLHPRGHTEGGQAVLGANARDVPATGEGVRGRTPPRVLWAVGAIWGWRVGARR